MRREKREPPRDAPRLLAESPITPFTTESEEMMKRINWTTSLREWVAMAGMSVFVATGAAGLLSPIAVIAAEDTAKGAATVEEAPKAIDLRTLTLPEGATVGYGRLLGSVNYDTSADMKKAFQIQQQQLTKLGWKELPGAMNQPEYSMAYFQKNGFVLSLMSYASSNPDKPGSQVHLNNLGNVPLNKLPTVKGAKPLTVNEAVAGYTTTLKPADAAEATRKLLVESGWEPYGTASNPPDSEVMTFKRNAIRLIAFVGANPTQKNQVMISYSTSLLSADLPAIGNPKEVEYDDAQKTLRFLTTESFDAVAKSYQQRLTKSGWTPKTNELQKSKYADDRPLGELAFGNGAKDSLLLQLTEQDGKTQVRLSLKTAADIAALQAELKAAQEKLAAEEKARKDEEAAAAKPGRKVAAAKKPAAKSDDDGFPDVDALIKGAVGDALKEAGLDGKKSSKGNKNNAAGKDAVSVPIPAGAKKVTQTSDNVLQIKWPGGKGQASAEALRDQLLAAGWEAADGDSIDKTSGNVTFTKDGKQMNLTFVDAGIGDVNMMLIGVGVKLTEGKADPDAKIPVASTKPKSKPADEPSDDDAPKTTKKKSNNKKSKSADNKPVVNLPKRAEKPSRGIAKLDKLPTEVKLVAQDKPVELPHVIAYEIVDGDRWVTRILATQTPIKQSMLIDLLKSNEPDHNLTSMSPRLMVALDDQDQLINMNYAGNDSLGSGRKVTGEAIVEEGRARGHFKANEESEFFGKTIIGEITFDVPVITRDSQPIKQLTNAKKLETSGKLVVNNQSMKLSHFISYQVKLGDEVRTAILFSEKPINVAKLKESLAKDGSDSGVIDFASHVKVMIDKEDRLAFLNLYTDGASINQNTDLVGEVIVEDLRARGTVKLGKNVEFFGKVINFDMTFDLEVLPLPTTAKE
jgi:ribosomal 50S subunit-recycling heat shock protein